MTHVVYISTEDGLFRAPLPAEAELEPPVEAVGLEGLGGVRCPVVVDCEDHRRLYAGTVRAGVWRSDDGGASWAAASDGLVYQEVWALTQNAATGELYAGTCPATAFRSSDGGGHWEECGAFRQGAWRRDWFLHVPPYVPRLRGFDLVHEKGGVIVGAVEEGWVVVSHDGGDTWSNGRDGLEVDAHMPALAVDDPSVVLVACAGGMFRSTDTGASFSPTAGFDRPYVTHVAPAPDGTIYGVGARATPDVCRVMGRSEPGVYASTDRGATWTGLAGPPQDTLAIPRACAAVPDRPLTVLTGMTDGSVWMTDDEGRRCRPLVQGLSAVGALAIAPAP